MERDEIFAALKRIKNLKTNNKQKNKARERVFQQPDLFVPIINECEDEGELLEYIEELPGPPHQIASSLKYLSIIFNKCDLFPQQPLMEVPEDIAAYCDDEESESPPTPQLEQRLRAYAEQTMSAIVAHIQDTHTVKKVENNNNNNNNDNKPIPPAKKKPAKMPKQKKVNNTNYNNNNNNNNNGGNNTSGGNNKNKKAAAPRQPKVIQNVSDDEDDGSNYQVEPEEITANFESVETKDDPRAQLLRIKQDSGLKASNVFLVESKWPTQRLVLQGKFPIKLIMITMKHAKWMMGFAKQHNIQLVPPGTSLEDALSQLKIENNNNNENNENNNESSVAKPKSNAGKPLKVFLVSEEVMEEILGYVLHRGCMALAERVPVPSMEQLLKELLKEKENEPIMIVLAEHVSNPDNVGAMFRSALALGASAVFLDTTSSDPLYRKCIRSSMGAVTKLPYAWITNFKADMQMLRNLGFAIFALALTPDSVPLAKVNYPANRHVAVMVGHEGDGLSKEAIAEADQSVKIEMVAHSVDSLNVSACTSVALYTIAHTIQLLQ